ncbi:DUF5025 domain-containing protein [Mucilaginibacter sp. CSA2-8R]|uniref:DUF5025 domain-containing protein n=1 Tax=Mucilaginibacter sp. CSA2-8R TaxID=3141542 RepID=UPI00315DE410
MACKKQDSVSSGKQPAEFSQQLAANIAGKAVVLNNTMSQNREILKGMFTMFGDNGGQRRQMYNIDAAISALDGDINTKSTFRIQLNNVKTGIFDITGEDSVFQPLTGSYAVLSIRSAANSYSLVLYTASVKKQPFKVQVTGFEYPPYSSIPTVTGTFNGVLYNTQNIADSVIVKNGAFKVRF